MGRKRRMKVPRRSSSEGVDIRPSDVFYGSWGYDQTNIDFIIVDEVSPTGKTVLCRMMSHKVAKSGPGYENVVPNKPYGQKFRLKVRSNDSLVGSYPFARGATRFGYFSRWHRKPVYQTPFGLGH